MLDLVRTRRDDACGLAIHNRYRSPAECVRVLVCNDTERKSINNIIYIHRILLSQIKANINKMERYERTKGTNNNHTDNESC